MKPMSIEKERAERIWLRKYWWLGFVMIGSTIAAKAVLGLVGLWIDGLDIAGLMLGAVYFGLFAGYFLRIQTEIKVRKSGNAPSVEELEQHWEGKSS
jgi:hypothetical protein